jgi:hypothetical protein
MYNGKPQTSGEAFVNCTMKAYIPFGYADKERE